MANATNSSVWENVTLAGCGLLAFGFGAFCLNMVTDFGANDTLLFYAIGLGLLCLLSGIVGVAAKLEKHKRRKIGTIIFLAPLAICAVAGMVDPNVHGAYPVFVVALIPVSILGLLVLVFSLRS